MKKSPPNRKDPAYSPLSGLKGTRPGDFVDRFVHAVSQTGPGRGGGLSAARLKLGIACVVLSLVLASFSFASGGEYTGTGIRTFTVLVGVIIALFVLAWAARKYGPYARVKKSIGLDVIGQVPVGVKANLALVRVGKSILLLGVTQNQISFLKDLEQGDFEKAVTEAENRGMCQ